MEQTHILNILEESDMNINVKEDIKPISYIKTNAADMIDYINDYKNPIIITQHGEARGVLLDIESYQNMVNALSIMKLLQVSEKSIQDGRVYDNEEVFSSLRAKIRLAND
jgi:prevent-host-death family protein